MSELTMNGLAAMSVAELDEVYRQGKAPESLSELDGDLRGRALAAVLLDRAPFRLALRGITRSRLFPWAGKSFRAQGSGGQGSGGQRSDGEGVNRLRLLGRRRWFVFSTALGHSALDGEPCVVFDYDRPSNPWPVRQIHDELRRLTPSLYLGPAMWKTRGAPRLLFYFGLERV